MSPLPEKVKVRKANSEKVRTTKIHERKPQYAPTIEEGLEEMEEDERLASVIVTEEEWADYELWLDSLDE